MTKKILSALSMAALAFLAAANYCLFVFPSGFAPAGIDGVCTMVQDLLHINMGYFALLLNIPLIIAAFCILNREFAVKSTVFVISFSLSVIWLKQLDLSALTLTGAYAVFAPLAAGVVRGMLYFTTLKLNGSAGGIDILSALIKHKKPHLELMGIIFYFNMAVAACSYFVYGHRLEPVICSILYSFVTSTVCNNLRAKEGETLKYEIITRQPEQLCQQITGNLHQKATILDAHGAYTGEDTKMVLCIVSKKDAPYLEEQIRSTQDCITFKSPVKNSIAGISYI